MHEILYHNFPVSMKKSEIEATLNDYCEESCDTYSPLPNPIIWLEEVYENREQARAAIEKRDEGSFYGQFATMYKCCDSNKYSDKVDELTDKYAEACKKWQEAVDVIHYAATTSEYVGCKGCGSRFKRELMIKKPNANFCPMCGIDMRPETTQKKIQAYKVKAEESLKKVQERKQYEQSKLPSKINWLVKTEWHV